MTTPMRVRTYRPKDSDTSLSREWRINMANKNKTLCSLMFTDQINLKCKIYLLKNYFFCRRPVVGSNFGSKWSLLFCNMDNNRFYIGLGNSLILRRQS